MSQKVVHNLNNKVQCIINLLWHTVGYTPAGKYFENFKKNWTKISHLHWYAMCAYEVSRQTNIFYGLCKKIKEKSLKKAFFNTKFYLFYTQHKKKYRFFREQLCKHIECWDVCVKFYLRIFWYFKILKTRSICSRVPKHCCIENLLWHMGAYLLLPQEKALWKCKKIPNKNPTLTSRHAMSTFQVSDKQEGFFIIKRLCNNMSILSIYNYIQGQRRFRSIT
jgi:hypothetical protein